jgi:hypothetical protein
MFKGIEAKWLWIVVAACLVCLGIGSFLSTVIGIAAFGIGLVIAWMWYSKYGKKKTGTPMRPGGPTAPTTSERKPLDKYDR